jgi:hypothetical protein
MTEEKKAKRVITKPGTVRVVVTLTEKQHELLVAEGDGRPINLWATRIVAKHCETLGEK